MQSYFSQLGWHNIMAFRIDIITQNMKRTTGTHQLIGKQKRKGTKEEIREIDSYRPERYALPHGYFSHPSPQQIFANNGQCTSLIIGNLHGRVHWKGTIDISSLAAPLAETVVIGDGQIEVYIGDRGKPQIGKELNRPCLATFANSSALQRHELARICRLNETKLVTFEAKPSQFTVMIPHFTFYSFTKVQKPKREAEEAKRLANTTIGLVRRNRIIEESNEAQSNASAQQSYTAPLTSSRFQAEATDEPSFFEEPTRTSDLFDGLKDFIINAEGKLYESETKLPVRRLQQSPEALVAQNNNREVYGYPPYLSQALNIPALQNFMFAAEGQIVEIHNYPNHKKLIFIPSPQRGSSRASRYNPLFLLDQQPNPETLARLACSHDMELPIRRFVSLFAVLFSDRVSFTFDKKKEYSPALSVPYSVDKRSRLQLIKNWLTWTARMTQAAKVTDCLPYKSKLMSALALRKPILAQESLIVNDSWPSAMVLPSLQDSYLRENLSQDNVEGFQSEIRLVLGQSIADLKCTNWLVCLSLCAWYFKKKPFMDNLSQIVNSQLFRSNSIKMDNTAQFRLFQLYLCQHGVKNVQPLEDSIGTSTTRLCYHWLTTNWLNLHAVQKTMWVTSEQKGPLLFSHIKYQVTRTLVEKIADKNCELALKVIEQTKDLSDKQLKVLRGIVERHQTRERRQDWESRLSKSWIEALQFGLSIEPELSLNKQLHEIAANSHLLASYNSNLSKRLQQLLSQHPVQFSDLLLVLRFEDDQTIGLEELRRLISIYEGKTRLKSAMGPKLRGAILSKLKAKLRHWIDRKKEKYNGLLQDVQLLQTLRKMLKGSEIAEYLSIQNPKQSRQQLIVQ